MPADTTSRIAPATRSHGCRQSPSLTLRCRPTALFRNRNTSAPGGDTARLTDAAVAPDMIMAAQRPSFPACPWSLLSDITERGDDASPVPDVYRGTGENRAGGDRVVGRLLLGRGQTGARLVVRRPHRSL